MASRRRERGFGAAYFMVLVAAAAVTLLSLSERVGVGTVRAGLESQHERARYLALAGAEHALWRLQHQTCFLRSSLGVTFVDSLGDGQYTYRVLGTAGDLRIHATGALGRARSSIDRRLERPPSAAPATLAYGLKLGRTPSAREYQSGTWMPATGVAVNTGRVYWCVVRGSMQRDESLLVSSDESSIQLQARGNGIWTNLGTLSTEARTGSRVFDVAYESSSGQGLVVYRSGGEEVSWRTWDGVNLGPAHDLALPTTGNIRWLALAPQIGTDWMTMVAITADSQVAGAIWNGDTFTGTALVGVGLDPDTECAAATFVGSTGAALFTWSAGAVIGYRTWNGAWTAIGAVVPNLGLSNWVRLASRPGSTQVLIAALQADRKLVAVTWNGAWDVSSTRMITDNAAEDWRCFDLAFDLDGDCLLAYGVRSSAAIQGSLWNATSGWTALAAGPVLGSEIRFVQLRSDPSTNLVHFAVSSRNNSEEQLLAGAWSGGWGAAIQIAGALSAKDRESFMLAPHADFCLLMP